MPQFCQKALFPEVEPERNPQNFSRPIRYSSPVLAIEKGAFPFPLDMYNPQGVSSSSEFEFMGNPPLSPQSEGSTSDFIPPGIQQFQRTRHPRKMSESFDRSVQSQGEQFVRNVTAGDYAALMGAFQEPDMQGNSPQWTPPTPTDLSPVKNEGGFGSTVHQDPATVQPSYEYKNVSQGVYSSYYYPVGSCVGQDLQYQNLPHPSNQYPYLWNYSNHTGHVSQTQTMSEYAPANRPGSMFGFSNVTQSSLGYMVHGSQFQGVMGPSIGIDPFDSQGVGIMRYCGMPLTRWEEPGETARDPSGGSDCSWTGNSNRRFHRDEYNLPPRFRGPSGKAVNQRNERRLYNVKLEDFPDEVLKMAKDRIGSRYIQEAIQKGGEGRDKLYNIIRTEIMDVACHMYGNYVARKFIECGSLEQKAELSKFAVNHMGALTGNKYGTRLVQEVLEQGDRTHQDKILREVWNSKDLWGEYMIDPNKNHIIQTAIKMGAKRYPGKIRFILDFIGSSRLTRASELSMHTYGSRVIQAILEHCSEAQKAPIIDALIRYVVMLAEDQFGNYVIQKLVEFGTEETRFQVCKGLRGNLLPLAQSKFGSPVIEKCLDVSSEDTRKRLIEEILHGYDAPRERTGTWSEKRGNACERVIKLLLHDQFGNYVLQTLVKVAKGRQREEIFKYLGPLLSDLRNSRLSSGLHIFAKFEKFFSKLSLGLDSNG